MLKEFKDFINRGNVLTVAIGLVMALYFQAIIDAVLDGVIKPIIAAIFGKPSLGDVGFNLRDGAPGEAPTRLSIGMVIDAAIMFVIVAFVLFLIIKAYNKYVAKPEEDAPSEDELSVLIEIRDALRNR
ncbi:MAG TPA: large conductance mechanosensitive channel protein MscL [Ilumatobacter sp.]|nr:large conductance mechanosensitive channel protein MscL [Ilumatobacter sp.]